MRRCLTTRYREEQKEQVVKESGVPPKPIPKSHNLLLR